MQENEIDSDQTVSQNKNTPPHTAWKRPLGIAAAILAGVILLAGSYVGYLYAASPPSIRQPLYEHYHFRMQVIVNGKPENFAAAKYQEGYSKDNCNAALTVHPIHFHDKKDQFVHIHWEGMTGGQVLKYFGWNFIGGPAGSLGYRFDELPKLQKVPIHGNILPDAPDGASYYVYTGDETGYKERKFDDFTKQDLEVFFGKASNSPAHELNKQKRQSLLDKLEPTAYAHATEEHASESGGTHLGDEELKRLNNLIGNVVIFVQKDKPTDAQIKDRFNHLEPLSESTCAG